MRQALGKPVDRQSLGGNGFLAGLPRLDLGNIHRRDHLAARAGENRFPARIGACRQSGCVALGQIEKSTADEREGDEGEGNEMLVHAPHLCGDRVSGKVIAPMQRRLFAAFAQIDQQGDNDTQRQTA